MRLRRKAAPADRHDLETVDRDQFALELAEIDMEVAHRGAVDDAQQNTPARLDFDHLGIGEGAEVGEEGVIFDVVEVGRRGGAVRRRHARHAPGFDIEAGAPPDAAIPAMDPAFFSAAKICSGGVKLKSASMTTTSCWSARSRWSRMMSGAVIRSCSCRP